MKQLDSEILIRCQHGDKEAFRWVVQTYQQLVFSLSVKMLLDEEEAKDIVQETFIRVWLNISSYDTRHPFATWLYTIATRLCLDRLKAKNKLSIISKPEDESLLQRFATDADTSQIIENREWVAIVRTLAEELSTTQRLVFTLCHFEELTSEEVEQITGLDAKQVKSNLYVARQTIRKRLKALGYGQD